MPRKKRIVGFDRDGKKTVVESDFTPEEEAAADAIADQFATVDARRNACKAVDRHRLALIAARFPTVTNSAGLDILRTINAALPGNAASQELKQAIACDEFAKAKMAELDKADRTTAAAYDPATDSDWP